MILENPKKLTNNLTRHLLVNVCPFQNFMKKKNCMKMYTSETLIFRKPFGTFENKA